VQGKTLPPREPDIPFAPQAPAPPYYPSYPPRPVKPPPRRIQYPTLKENLTAPQSPREPAIPLSPPVRPSSIGVLNASFDFNETSPITIALFVNETNATKNTSSIFTAEHSKNRTNSTNIVLETLHSTSTPSILVNETLFAHKNQTVSDAPPPFIGNVSANATLAQNPVSTNALSAGPATPSSSVEFGSIFGAGGFVILCLGAYMYKRYKHRTELKRKRALSALEQNVPLRDRFLNSPSTSMQTNPLLGMSSFETIVNPAPKHRVVKPERRSLAMMSEESILNMESFEIEITSQDENISLNTCTDSDAHDALCPEPYDPTIFRETSKHDERIFVDTLHVYDNPLANHATVLQELENVAERRNSTPLFRLLDLYKTNMSS
jgi:hypothetical protein